ncbi:methyl-accepting chemotaxis protein [Halovibrio variabilis]|uniref:Methyl-accepting chemotaxis protein n=1 Tax=Halovibrio variabilis TaxID=31910 RepID=A0A511URW8_9GAMM|nr:methyl-accepting chemotaxis protein [Halovibrio variabilis]
MVLSIIDPINHSRTLRVRLMEYMNTVESSNLESASTLNDLRETVDKMDGAFQAYLDAPRLDGEAALTDAYQSTYLAYRDRGIEPLIEAAEANDRQQFQQQIETVVQLDRQFEIELDNVLALHEQNAKRLNDEAQSRFVLGIYLIIAFGVLFLIVMAAVVILLKRSVLTPLENAKKHCGQIAEGMLATPVPVITSSRSEIQDLMRTLEQMRQSLTGIISQIRNSTQTVSDASKDIATGNVDLASRTDQQAAALTQTASSMVELSATVKQNNDNVLEASRLTSETVENAKTGEKISEEVIATMGLINSNSRKIEDITGVINSIAFQSNILALNASVEAARAGEQGRGFAVVAGEVRNLAKRSAIAAQEIESLVAESVANIQAGSGQVSQTGKAIATIIDSISRVNIKMEHISAASDEQSQGISQVEQAVTEMDGVTQQNSIRVQETAAAAASLEEQALHLMQAVSTFCLADNTQNQLPAGGKLALGHGVTV